MDALVIGAGISGLTTGICLAEAGLAVTIRTASPPERTTSAAAGAIWGLVRVGPRERVLRWGRTGLEIMSRLAAEPGTGVRMVSGREVTRAAPDPHYWTELLPDLRMCRADELPDGFAGGWRYTAPVATMPAYLGYLSDRFARAGGTIEMAPVGSLAEVAGAAAVVVNCTGVAAHHLVPDPAVTPVRGQVVVAANPGIEEFLIDRDEEPPWIVYMFPHGDTVLLGGTNEEGSWDEEPEPEIAERIVAACCAIDPRLRGAAVLGHRVGLRPYRPEVRLEPEPRDGGVLWHNYGNGGAGVSLSWGCAAEIAAAVCSLGLVLMRFAIAIPQFYADGQFDPEAFRAYLARAEELGFDGAWAQEGVLGTMPGFSPVEAMTFAAACTRRLRLGCAVFVSTLHSPVHLAKSLATVDQLSRGRVEIGVGTGGGRRPFAAFGVSPDRYVARFTEGIALMKALWTQDRVSFGGEFWRLEGAAMEPKPFQKPHPPLWFGAASPAALRRAVRLGDGFIGAGSSTTAAFAEQAQVVRDALADAGRPAGSFPIAKRVYIAIDEDAGRARQRVNDALGRLYGQRVPAIEAAAIAGRPADCLREVRQVAEAGAELILFTALFDQHEQMERVAAEIVPAFG